MIYIAHSHDHSGSAENQWAHVVSHWRNIEVIKYADIPPDVPMILLAPKDGYRVQGTEALPDFEHPESACYVYGSDHKHFQLDWLPRSPDHAVFIPLESYVEMYSWVACAVVMYDRSIKHG